MTILSIEERIKLFKEINRVHKTTYGWNIIYNNAWSGIAKIDIDRDVILFEKPKPMNKSDIKNYYFFDSRGKDITLQKGLFAWQAYYFEHVNPIGQSDEDDKSVRLDIDRLIHCLISLIEIHQRKDDGMIWISSNWLHDPDCYASASSFIEAIGKAVNEAAGGNKELADELWSDFEKIIKVDRSEFNRALKVYFRGGKMTRKLWFNEYVLAASRPWKIKTMEQLEEALEVEDEHFQKVLEEFLQWFRDGELNLGEKAEEGIRKKIRELYSHYPCDIARSFCKRLVEEDKKERSDVYLWWGGEPTRDGCYALLTLYFEIVPEDIGTSRFDEKVSRNLKTIINIAEEEYPHLSTYRDIEPHIWRAIFT